MAALTWRNVDAPDFRGALDGYRIAGDLLTKATTGLGRGLDSYQDFRTEATDRQAQAALLRYQDPAALKAALESGALFQGLDQARIRPATLERAGNQVSKLLSNSINTENLQQNVYDNQYSNAERLREIDARMPFAINAERNGGLPSSIVGQLPIAEQGRLRAGDQGATSAQRINNLNQEGDDLGNLAIGVVQSALSNNATPNQFRNVIEGGNYTPKQKTAIYAAYEKSTGQKLIGPSAFYDPFDPVSVGGVNKAATTLAKAAGVSDTVIPTGPRPTGGAEWAKFVGLVANESGGNTTAENNAVGSGGKVGHFGLLQFGQDRLSDAKSAGIIPKNMTPEQFRDSSAEVQNKVADWHFDDIDKQSQSAGLDSYYGKTVKGVTIDRDSIRGMAHLGGITGVKKFISSNGQYDPADVNGTKISDYGKKFGGSPIPAESALSRLVADASGRTRDSDSVPLTQPGAATSAPVAASTIPLTQQEADRQKISDLIKNASGVNQDMGRAILDIGMMPLRGAIGAYDSTVIRGMKALGINADYWSPMLVPDGVDPSSMTPYTDQRRAQQLQANPNIPAVTPASVPATTNRPAGVLAAAAEVPKLTSVAQAEMLQAAQERQGERVTDQNDPSNLARYMETFKSGPGDDGGFIKELEESPTLKNNGVSSSAVTAMYYKIKEATGQPGAVVASAIKHLAKTDEFGSGFNWLLEKPFSGEGSTDSLGKNVGVSERKLGQMIDFLKTNEIDKVVMNNKGIKASDGELKKQLDIAKSLEAQLLTERVKAAAGVPNSAARMSLIQNQLQVELDKYQLLTSKRQSNSAFIPRQR